MMGKFWYSVCDKVQGRGEFCELGILNFVLQFLFREYLCFKFSSSKNLLVVFVLQDPNGYIFCILFYLVYCGIRIIESN